MLENKLSFNDKFDFNKTQKRELRAVYAKASFRVLLVAYNRV